MPGEYKLVASYDFLSEAQVAQSKLKAEGIDALLEDKKSVSMLPMYSKPSGQIHVYVPQEVLERARDLLVDVSQSGEGQ